MRFWIGFVVVMLIKSKVSFGQFKTDFGVKAGFNYSTLELSSLGRLAAVTSYHWKPSFHVGLYGTIQLPKKSGLERFTIQPEIVFSDQGHKYSTFYNSDLRTALYYINVPVIIKYYFLPGVNLQFGPQVGFIAGAKGDLLQIYNGNLYGPALDNQPLKTYVNRTDFSLAFGTGFDFPFGGNLTFRYSVGISDTNQFTNSSNLPMNGNNFVLPSISTTYSRNKVFQVSLGYKLKKKKK